MGFQTDVFGKIKSIDKEDFNELKPVLDKFLCGNESDSRVKKKGWFLSRYDCREPH